MTRSCGVRLREVGLLLIVLCCVLAGILTPRQSKLRFWWTTGLRISGFTLKQGLALCTLRQGVRLPSSHLGERLIICFPSGVFSLWRYVGTPPTKRRRIETPQDQRSEDQPGYPLEDPDAPRLELGDVDMAYRDDFGAPRECLERFTAMSGRSLMSLHHPRGVSRQWPLRCWPICAYFF